MKANDRNIQARPEEAPLPGYRQVPWPERGRKVFGPWCLLGVWPAIFGVVEKGDEPKESAKDLPRK